ncbi:MAG: YbgF trimerization domain-containing protein, partial [Halofilum sp. (in: g-proteobacteria)]
MTRVRAVQTALALGVALALSAPVATADEPTTEELDRRMRRMENILDSGQIADLIQRTSELEREIRELRGELETQGHRMDELRKRQRNLYGDLDRRIRELEVAGAEAEESDKGSGDSGSGNGGGGSGAGSTAAVESGDSPEAGSGDSAESGDAASDRS